MGDDLHRLVDVVKDDQCRGEHEECLGHAWERVAVWGGWLCDWLKVVYCVVANVSYCSASEGGDLVELDIAIWLELLLEGDEGISRDLKVVACSYSFECVCSDKTIPSEVLTAVNGLEQERMLAAICDLEVGCDRRQEVGWDVDEDGDKVRAFGVCLRCGSCCCYSRSSWEARSSWWTEGGRGRRSSLEESLDLFDRGAGDLGVRQTEQVSARVLTETTIVLYCFRYRLKEYTTSKRLFQMGWIMFRVARSQSRVGKQSQAQTTRLDIKVT